MNICRTTPAPGSFSKLFFSARWVHLIILICVLQNTELAFGGNLALGRSYTMDPQPSYALTQDELDRVQLTDGKYTIGFFWRSKTTVGWQRSATIKVQIDLAQSQTINQICLNSARADGASVSFPQRVDVFASNNGSNYAYIGNVLQGQNNAEGPYLVQKFCAENNPLTARYVWFFVQAKGPFTFLDEIEVLDNGKKVTQSATYNQHRDAIPQMQQTLATLGDSASSLHFAASRLLSTIDSGDEKGETKASAAVRSLVASLTQQTPSNKDAIAKIENDLRAATAEVQRERFKESLLVWHDDPWKTFTTFETPEMPKMAVTDVAPVKFDLMRGGTASGAINVSNASSSNESVTVVARLNSSTTPVPTLVVREAASIITAKSQVRADPLVPIRANEITLQPGESRQIWLTIFSREAKPGSYVGEVTFQPKSDPSKKKSVALAIEVHSVQFPKRQRLNANNWGYMNWRPIQNLTDQALQDLAAHHINIFPIHPSQLPWNNNYTKFDQTISLYPKGTRFLFFMNFKDPYFQAQGGKGVFLSSQWKASFLQWIQQWVAHNQRLGLTYTDFAFYPFDEPQTSEEANILFQVASIIKSVDPNLRVYTTLLTIAPTDLAKLAQVVDIFQILTSDLMGIRGTFLKELKKEIWSYTAEGGGKEAHPLGFYRNQAWKAFKAEAVGIGFWAYADTGATGTAWNDADGTRPDFSVIYEGDKSLIGSKRWEAWREGVEDYELLRQARDHVYDGQEVTEFWSKIDDVLRFQSDYQRLQSARLWMLDVASR